MAPDRGNKPQFPAAGSSYQALDAEARSRSRSPLIMPDGQPAIPSPISAPDNRSARTIAESKRSKQAAFLASRAAQPQNFTLRAILVGALIGTVICLSNTYFGLQTGWISGMAMPSALLGFAWFRTFSRFLNLPFTPVENVLVQCVAGAVGTMPLGVGLVGVLPALEKLTKTEEGGPFEIPLGKLIIWSVGVCFFGVFVAVPLRHEVLIREKLKFPSGTATGLMICVLHNDDEALEQKKETDQENEAELTGHHVDSNNRGSAHDDDEDNRDDRGDWKNKIRKLLIAFGGSFGYTLLSYFAPQIRAIPILGTYLSSKWLWQLNPSPAYVGQGVIMGPATTIHMLLGAILGWAILSPIAKNNGWAAGAVDDWEKGSKGWITWVSLAIMLADSLVNLAWLVLRPAMAHGPSWYRAQRALYNAGELKLSTLLSTDARGAYQPLDGSGPNSHSLSPRKKSFSVDTPEADSPPEHLPGNKVTYGGLVASSLLCIVATHLAFPGLIPVGITFLSVIFALLLSIMGVRALGETDLNPVSGISKLAQLVFATILPHTPAAIPANLLAGAISESAALQAGDLLQDLKTGHILGASPKFQFYGQLIGSGIGAVIASCVYKLYTSVYEIPSKGLFEIPTAYVWIFTARLVTGQGLPPKAGMVAGIAGAVWVVLTILRIRAQGKWWQSYIPGGIAVAVGMYNTPSFTLARTMGGLLSLYWSKTGRSEASLVVLASGLILGEGVGSIANLLLASGKVPHL